jgi:uncharacterized protein
MKRDYIALSLLLVTLFAAPVTYSASFDCTKAKSNIEKNICSDANLSKLDDDLSAAYRAATADSRIVNQLRRDQREWLTKRNACRDHACIKTVYETRLEELFSILDRSRATNCDPQAGLVDGSCLGNPHTTASSILSAASPFGQTSIRQASDIERFRKSQQLLSETRLFVDPDFRQQPTTLCMGLVKAFRSGQNLKVVEPILRTNDPQDPALAKYQTHCPAVPLLEIYSISRNFFKEFHSLTQEERKAKILWYGNVAEARPPFSLYELQEDIEGRRDVEYLLFFQSSYGPKRFARSVDPSKVHDIKPHPQYGGYKVLALRDCDLTGLTEFTSPDDPSSDPIHGVVSVSGRNYVYALSSSDCDQIGEQRSFSFLQTVDGRYLEAVCLFTNDIGIKLHSMPNDKGVRCVGNL